MSSIYTGKLIFDGDECRTQGLNNVVATIRALGMASAGTEKGQDSKTGILSEEMNQTGHFSNHFMVDLGWIAELSA